MGSNEITGIQELRGFEPTTSPQELRRTEAGQSFAGMLTDAISGVDEAMKDSDQKIQDFLAGKTENVHDVMISMQRAQLSFQLMVEIRNKAIEAYHEISRMQI